MYMYCSTMRSWSLSSSLTTGLWLWFYCILFSHHDADVLSVWILLNADGGNDPGLCNMTDYHLFFVWPWPFGLLGGRVVPNMLWFKEPVDLQYVCDSQMILHTGIFFTSGLLNNFHPLVLQLNLMWPQAVFALRAYHKLLSACVAYLVLCIWTILGE